MRIVKSIFFYVMQEPQKQKIVEQRLNSCLRLITSNERRCKEQRPVYGKNLLKLLTISRKWPELYFADYFKRVDLLKPILDR